MNIPCRSPALLPCDNQSSGLVQVILPKSNEGVPHPGRLVPCKNLMFFQTHYVGPCEAAIGPPISNRGSGGLGSMGLQFSGLSISVKQKENGAEKIEKVQKERILECSKEKIIPSFHTVSWKGEAEPTYRETNRTLWQTIKQYCAYHWFPSRDMDIDQTCLLCLEVFSRELLIWDCKRLETVRGATLG